VDPELARGGGAIPRVPRQHVADESPLEFFESRRLSRLARAILDLQPVGQILDLDITPGFVRRLSYSRTATAPAESSESASMAANPDMVCPAGSDCPHAWQRMTAEEEGRQTAVVT